LYPAATNPTGQRGFYSGAIWYSVSLSELKLLNWQLEMYPAPYRTPACGRQAPSAGKSGKGEVRCTPFMY
jgi:hypothetical protein